MDAKLAIEDHAKPLEPTAAAKLASVALRPAVLLGVFVWLAQSARSAASGGKAGAVLALSVVSVVGPAPAKAKLACGGAAAFEK